MKYTELRAGDLFMVVGMNSLYKFVRTRQRRSIQRNYDEIECQSIISGIEQPFNFTFTVDLDSGGSLEIELRGIDVQLYKALAACIAFISRNIDHVSVESNAVFDLAWEAQGAFEKQYPSFNK
jgi:hypothetical protein